jgi:hypothetical protein
MVELRRLLGEARSPLMGDLMATFSALLKEYKGEVEEILVADKQVGHLGRDGVSCRGGAERVSGLTDGPSVHAQMGVIAAAGTVAAPLGARRRPYRAPP